MINIYKFNAPLFQKKLCNEEQIKNLLQLINEIPKTSYAKISHTDWELAKDTERKYARYFYDDVVKEYMEELANFHLCKNGVVHNIWFQQYYTNDEHPWHTHISTNYTNVVYLELPNNTETQILDPISKKIISNIKVNEGDVLTFPGFLLHRSAENKTTKRKTIISFNSSFTDVKNEEIKKYA